jgi:hypothetical protein
MDASPGPEQVNPESLAAFGARAAEPTPVVMLNLHAFKPDGGQESYGEYGAAVAPLLEMIGPPEYQAIAHLPEEALVRGELHPLDPADAP